MTSTYRPLCGACSKPMTRDKQGIARCRNRMCKDSAAPDVPRMQTITEAYGRLMSPGPGDGRAK
jgi:hypothetical protein